MKTLLFLTQRLPYPPNKGDKIRSFAVLKHLAKSWRIHLGCFIDDPADRQYVDALNEFCAETMCIELNPRAARLRALRALVRGGPLSEAYFADARLAAWVRRVKPDAAFLYSSVMGQYLRGVQRPPRVVMDFVDVDSDKWRQYAERQSWPMSWVYRREAARLLEFDRAMAVSADAVTFVSEAEAQLFRRQAPETAAKIRGISNGIDLDTFAPGPYPAPFTGPTMVFTGAMDYWPNVDAVGWFSAKILPRIRASLPTASFVIVGSNPTDEVRRLAELPGVTVTGRVPDVRPYLAHAHAVVAPMRVARGIQNKVLEGMAMGRPVITTPQGLEGIHAEPGRHLLLASGADDFAAAVLGVLNGAEGQHLGAAARAQMVACYDWSDKLAAFSRLLE
ncbi:MAG: TIGR03087 family PEP-CTERM/XrtA system glycosyltransferase [Rhodospirillaceae bacterium]|nr:TIGR03087 family PEP-CTERM/XrtA system glycosyltransferase [Rhodospirillales bacterium]